MAVSRKAWDKACSGNAVFCKAEMQTTALRQENHHEHRQSLTTAMYSAVLREKPWTLQFRKQKKRNAGKKWSCCSMTMQILMQAGATYSSSCVWSDRPDLTPCLIGPLKKATDAEDEVQTWIRSSRKTSSGPAGRLCGKVIYFSWLFCSFAHSYRY